MRQILLAALVCGAGCRGVDGPVQRLCRPARIDDPCLSIPEQEERGRERLALPEKSDVAPRTYGEEPAYRGRF